MNDETKRAVEALEVALKRAGEENAIRVAEHQAWMGNREAELESAKLVAENHKRDLQIMLEWHAARMATEEAKRQAATAERDYWKARDFREHHT